MRRAVYVLLLAFLLLGLGSIKGLYCFVDPARAANAAAKDKWTRTFGDEADDWVNSVQQTEDGGYIVAGGTKSYGAGNYDVWLIKTDANGNKLWSKTFGGKADDWAWSVQQTEDGGYIVAGRTQSYGADSIDACLIKTDANGKKLWSKTFGGKADDFANSVQQTEDGGYIVAGYTGSYGAGNYDVWLIKTDANGKKLWDKAFGDEEDDWANSVQQTEDGGYIVAGWTESYGAGSSDAWLIKTDANGKKLWGKTFGGEEDDWANSVQQTEDGGYIVAGYTGSYGAGSIDACLIKTDANGKKLWGKTFGGEADDWADSVQQTEDGGYIVAGGTKSYGAGNYDVWLIKTDANGNMLWDKAFGGEADDFANSVQQTKDGGYIVAGWTESYGAGSIDACLIKTDANGNTIQ